MDAGALQAEALLEECRALVQRNAPEAAASAGPGPAPAADAAGGGVVVSADNEVIQVPEPAAPTGPGRQGHPAVHQTEQEAHAVARKVAAHVASAPAVGSPKVLSAKPGIASPVKATEEELPEAPPSAAAPSGPKLEEEEVRSAVAALGLEAMFAAAAAEDEGSTPGAGSTGKKKAGGPRRKGGK